MAAASVSHAPSIHSHNSLRDRQIASIKKILNLNHDPESDPDKDRFQTPANGIVAPSVSIVGSDGEPIWKVLVFDDLGRDVISSVLRVSELRAAGVTMHMHIAASRHPIPDVPVIYLLEPTARNLDSITSDLAQKLYSPAHINFLTSISRPSLESFAEKTAAAGTAEDIAKIHDQYLNFIVAEPDLFTLGMASGHTYSAINSATTSDAELDKVIDRIVSGLFSVCVTMAVVPIIRCDKGPGEMVARALDRKLRDHILNSKDNNLFSTHKASGRTGTTPSSRPVLIILDRNVDLVPCLSHSWTYQSLVHDVLQIKLNRILVETPVDENDPARGRAKKAYDLTANDFFWAKNAALPFPQVAEDIDAELTRYKEDTAAITKRTGVSSLDDLQMDTSSGAQHLKAAITLLPELRDRKAVLDMHMTILAALMTGIKNRQIDSFFQMEDGVMKQPKEQVLEIIQAKDKGADPTDKLRLFIIWFLTVEQDLTRAEFSSFEAALAAAGADTTSLSYIKQVRATTRLTQLTTVSSAPQQQGSSSNLFNTFSSMSTRFTGLTERLKETGVPAGLSANFEHLIGGIKNFLPVNRDLTVTKIVESLMEPSTASSSAIAKTENYLYFDPRSANARGTTAPPSTLRAAGGIAGGPSGFPGAAPGTGASFGQRRQGFSDAIVFMVGGGSMDEYGNLQEWVVRAVGGGNSGTGGGGGGGGGGDRGKKRIVYGCTEMLNAAEFIQEELERLGREVKG